jgi:serine/threonine-protein kinase
MGTPIYMSPEQCRGTRTVDHRSDIYSLGVIFYEMLVGQPPFVSEGFGDLVNMHLNVPPMSPRARRAEIPLAVDALVLKMLAKNPEDRYAEMKEIQGALKASGGSQFTVRASDPDLAKTHAKGAATSAMNISTFSTGAGERVETEIVGSGNGKKLIIGLAAAAAIAGGIFVWKKNSEPETTKPTTVAVTTPPKPVTPPTPTTPVKPTTPPATTPKKVELRLASTPSGAKVVDNVDGELLGLTPLVLTRPRGGTLTLRFEKDGYNSNTKTMPLDGDRAFELTLEQKPKKRDKKPREPSTPEPAKL